MKKQRLIGNRVRLTVIYSFYKLKIRFGVVAFLLILSRLLVAEPLQFQIPEKLIATRNTASPSLFHISFMNENKDQISSFLKLYYGSIIKSIRTQTYVVGANFSQDLMIFARHFRNNPLFFSFDLQYGDEIIQLLPGLTIAIPKHDQPFFGYLNFGYKYYYEQSAFQAVGPTLNTGFCYHLLFTDYEITLNESLQFQQFLVKGGAYFEWQFVLTFFQKLMGLG